MRSGFGLVGVVAVLAVACSPDADERYAATTEHDLTTFDEALPDVDAQRYDVSLVVDPTSGSEAFTAIVQGAFVATRDLTTLALDFDGNTVDEVLVGTAVVKATRSGDQLSIPLPQKVAKGASFDVSVRYHGKPRIADGADPNDFTAYGGFMLKRSNSEGNRIFSSLDWPSKARRWLPLRDHPRDGAMVSFQVEMPASFTVVANGKRTSVSDGENGTKVWRYQATTPMPTYDFHVVAYEGYEESHRTSVSGVDIASYVYATDRAAGATITGELPAAMDFYSKTFGPYRWETASFLEEPIFGGGMEHASVVSLDETLYADPSEGRIVAFHELAHHWSGNLVRIRDWADFWLSEGFAEYLTHRFVSAHDGRAAGEATLRTYEARARGAFAGGPHPLRPADGTDVLSIFDGISYQWGALTLRSLEHLVGTTTFTTFLQSWFKAHAFQAVGTADLKNELAKASGKNLDAFFDYWVYGKHGVDVPSVAVEVKAAAGAANTVTVALRQLSSKLDGWYVPLDVDLVTAKGTKRIQLVLDGDTAETNVALDGPLTGYVVDPDHWFGGDTSCDPTLGDRGGCRAGYTCRASVGGASPAMCR